MVKEVDADDREGHLGAQEGPAEGAATKAQLLLLFAPTGGGEGYYTESTRKCLPDCWLVMYSSSLMMYSSSPVTAALSRAEAFSFLPQRSREPRTWWQLHRSDSGGGKCSFSPKVSWHGPGWPASWGTACPRAWR